MAERAHTAEALPSRPTRPIPRLLSDLCSIPELADVVRSGEDIGVTGISSSSDQVEPGDLFAALPGSSGHGARFLGPARTAGAVAVLTDVEGSRVLSDAGADDLPLLIVDDPRAVLGAVSAEIYGHPSSKLAVYGITGTSGKTTTTFLVRAALQAAGHSTGLIGTVGVFVGDQVLKTPFTTPEAPQLQALLAVMAERGVTHVGMEVSSHALRMHRADGVAFAVGAFTNLSQDHLDFHSDMEDYFDAKRLLFDGRAAREVVVIDDEWGRRLVTPDTVTVATGTESDPDGADHSDRAVMPGADWTATDIHVLPDGASRFTVHGPRGTFDAGCRIPGAYNVTNTVLACAVLDELGVDPTAVAPALLSAQVRGRMERVDGDQPFLAVVDYSHKPAGVRGALQALRPLTPGRLIIVLGCGGDRDRGKRPVMGEVAAHDADVLIVTDDNPRSEDPASIRAAMLAGVDRVEPGQRAQIIEDGDRRSAITRAITMATDGDTVLVAGKGHETGQQVGATIIPFDDVTVVREALIAQGYVSPGYGADAPDDPDHGSGMSVTAR